MAVVYLAEDLKHGRQVAIKVLRAELSATIGVERFEREVTLVARLQHPNILPVFDSGRVAVNGKDVLYCVTPYVAGEALRGRMEREGRLPVEDALDIARGVLEALSYAHAQGVVHRDIKPENILLSGGQAMVTDFGIALAADARSAARLTEVGIAIGTPAYMSPEQASGERELDARSDLYSTACVLYEMLTGEPPFLGPNAQSILAKRLAEPAPSARRLRETIPPGVEAALTRGMARTPADRFPSAEAFVRALAEGRISAQTPALPRPARWGLAVVAVAAMAAALAWFGTRRETPTAPGIPKLALSDLVVASPDSSTEYLRSGIPDFLVSSLRRLPGLEVIPMSLVRRQSGSESPLELGRRVDATAVLTGSLARFGGTLWVNAELVEVRDGRLLWSGQFEYPDTSYSELIPAVVAVIADSLRLQLSGGDRRDAILKSAVDPVVLDLILRAGHGWLRGIAGAQGDSATIDSARMLYQRVLDRSPQNPAALAGLGNYYSISFIRGWAVPGLTPAQLRARADSLVNLALSLDSTIAMSWNVVVISRLYLDDDFEGAREAVNRTLALDSGYAEGYRERGIIRQEIDGDLKGALADYERAVELDPSVIRFNSLASGLMAARRYREAAAVLERSLADRPSVGARTRLLTTYERLGRHEDAIRIRRLSDPTGASAAPFEAALAAGDTAAYARARRAELRRTADSLIARLSMADVVPAERYNVAELRIGAILCELGEPKEAMDLVNSLYRIRPKRLRWIVTNVDLGCLRQDPRYLPVVKAAGLEPYLRN
jgi:eukaryotic-like serine/threonine-protein kinase